MLLIIREDMSLELSYKKVFKEYANPMMLRSVLNSLMHTADRLVAAMFIGAQALVATTITSPLMYFTYAVAALFIGGLGAYVGLLIGRDNIIKANQSASGILVILGIVGVMLTIPTYFFNEQLVHLLGAKGELIEMTQTYLKVFSLSFPFMLLGKGLDVLIYNDGSPRYSFGLNMITTALNFTFNIIAVAILDLGILGLAGATVISSAVQFVGGVVYFTIKPKIIKLSKPNIKLKTVFRIAYNGLSDFAMLLVDAVMIYIVNQAFVRYLTPNHFEAYAAANILMILFYGIFMGATMGLQPIFSQMMGKGKGNELKGLLNYSIKRTMVIGLLAYIGFMPVAGYLLNLLVDSREVLEIAKFFYVTMGFAVLFSNLPLQTSLFFTAINRPIESAVISVVRTLFLIPAIAYSAIVMMGAIGIAIGFLVTDLILIAVLVVYIKKLDISKLAVYE
jgi:Na+-driven multidrug efflux pump